MVKTSNSGCIWKQFFPVTQNILSEEWIVWEKTDCWFATFSFITVAPFCGTCYFVFSALLRIASSAHLHLAACSHNMLLFPASYSILSSTSPSMFGQHFEGIPGLRIEEKKKTWLVGWK